MKFQVKNRKQNTLKTPARQWAEAVIPEPNKSGLLRERIRIVKKQMIYSPSVYDL
jgi:hypothetical protein